MPKKIVHLKGINTVIAMPTRKLAKAMIWGLGVALAAGLLMFITKRYFAAKIADFAYLCHVAELNKDWVQLENASQEWTRLNPSNDKAWYTLAKALYMRRKWESLSSTIPRLSPSYVEFQQVMEFVGDAFIEEAGDVRIAEDCFLRLLVVFPHSEHAFQRLTYLYSMTLQREKLSKLLRLAIARQCEPPEAYVYLFSAPNLLFSDGLKRTEKWLAATPDFEPVQVAHYIYADIAKGGGATATQAFATDASFPGVIKGLGEMYPRNFELLAYLIEKTIEAGDLDEAVQLVERVQDSPLGGSSRFWRYKGWAEDYRGEHERALNFYNKALTIDPLDWKTRFELTSVERQLGKIESAELNSEIALEGKSLEVELKALARATFASKETIKKLAEYARKCQDTLVFERLKHYANSGP